MCVEARAVLTCRLCVQLTHHRPCCFKTSGGSHCCEQPIGIAVGTVATTLYAPAFFDQFVHAPGPELAQSVWSGEPWESPALKEIAAGIHSESLYWTSSGETTRAVAKSKWLLSYLRRPRSGFSPESLR